MKKDNLVKILFSALFLIAVFVFSGCDDPDKLKGLNVYPEDGLSLRVGETGKFRAMVDPVTASDKRVIWKSMREDVATVDEKGVVAAIGDGLATITCETYNGKFIEYRTVTVEQ
ncbi:Ig-like domain-containing protein [Bacteroidales bacterium OttesenSCG-928-J16]|nr:Ig-like domain-containing protein [Bacteroidales bacterium OttesenSCG-928-J16]